MSTASLSLESLDGLCICLPPADKGKIDGLRTALGEPSSRFMNVSPLTDIHPFLGEKEAVPLFLDFLGSEGELTTAYVDLLSLSYGNQLVSEKRAKLGDGELPLATEEYRNILDMMLYYIGEMDRMIREEYLSIDFRSSVG